MLKIIHVLKWYFNSRPREGADTKYYDGTNLLNIFQLTAPRGGRRYIDAHKTGPSSFQLTAPRGGRPVDGESVEVAVTFQLTAPRGGRP